jgi:serine/threonine protein kinase
MKTPNPLQDQLIADRYDVVSEIAVRGSLRIERAVDRRTNQYVILTRFAATLVEAHRVRAAVMVAGAIAHSHVAQLLDAGEYESGLFQIYTYIPGRLLADVIRDDAPLPVEDALQLALEIASGLRALHDAGLVHGALAPENVVIGWDGEVRLTAYIAPDLDVPVDGVSAYSWTAPEFLEGGATTVAADIFAAGSALGALLDESEAPAPVRDVLDRACAEHPRDRFRDARDLEAAIAEAMVSLRAVDAPAAIPAPAASPIDRTDASGTPEDEIQRETTWPPAPPPLPPLSLAAPASHGERLPAPLVAALLALVAVVGIALVVGYIVSTALGNDSPPRAVVAGVSEEGQLPGAGTLPDEPEIVDEPTINSRERDLMIARAVLTGSDEPIPPASAGQEPTSRPVVAAPEPTPVPVLPTPTSALSPTATATPKRESDVVLAFEVTDWEGAWVRADDGFLGRPWISLYGAESGFGEAEISFTLDRAPSGPATLRLVGLDDQSDVESRFEVWVNGRRLYGGDSPFPKWDGKSEDAPWTARNFPIPATALRVGENTIVILNANPSDRFGQPPFILISHASLTID